MRGEECKTVFYKTLFRLQNDYDTFCLLFSSFYLFRLPCHSLLFKKEKHISRNVWQNFISYIFMIDHSLFEQNLCIYEAKFQILTPLNNNEFIS